MIEKYQISFRLEITEVIDFGFKGKSEDKKLKKKSIIQDKYALDNHRFQGKVKVTLETISPEHIIDDIKRKEFVAFCCVVNEIRANGIYTKKYEENENPFKRVFWMDERGMMTFPDESWNRFEIGDVLKVKIEKAK